MMERRFNLGKVLVTKAVHERMSNDPVFELFVRISLGRYVSCDWGDLCEEDKERNDCAVKNGDERIFAAYIPNKREKDKIWIITEADRRYTTVLFPDDY